VATPEFWGTLTGAHVAVPVKDDAAIDSSVRVPIRSLVCEDPEGLQQLLLYIVVGLLRLYWDPLVGSTYTEKGLALGN
jgi:hypothetical protein